MPGIESKILDLIDRYNVREHSLITSFWPPILAKFKELASDLKLGVLCNIWDEEFLDIANRLNAYAILPDYRLVNEDIISKSHETGLKVIVWTVDNIDEARVLLESGVDGIITNDPLAIKLALQLTNNSNTY